MRPVLALLLLTPAVAAAQSIVTSPRPDTVAVTVYRNPDRSASDDLRIEWLGGYALVSETRRVRLPAGASELRFEGVASGILPQSAIVSGLGRAVIERNRDAYLLSPGTLLDRSLGERVHLRRTSKATGKMVEQDAIIRSGADGAVVIQTAAGIEALRCSGQSETLRYDAVPAGLSARPTLSVQVRSPVAVETAVTLSYLASGFDWQAHYVATINPAGDRLDLFAWLTLASSDDTSFVAARTSAVAGKLSRESAYVAPAQSRAINLMCWPHGTTSDSSRSEDGNYPPPPPPPAPPAAMAERGDAMESIVVTGSRMVARREDLGDLKLYAIPEPVTVAANSQKQVAMIEQRGVTVGIVYRSRLSAEGDGDSVATRTLVTRNRTVDGLGVPLPAGGVTLFETRDGSPFLIGEGSVDDKAVGEDVDIAIGEAVGVTVRQTALPAGKNELAVTNDRATPIRYEAAILTDGRRLSSKTRLARRNGEPWWAVTIPANGRAVLRYRTVAPR